MKSKIENSLEIKDLNINFNSYLGVAEVLKDLKFKIPKHSWFGLAGESGCGKSVTALSILKLLPDSAVIKSGEILFQGENLLEKSETQMEGIRGKQISMVFQDPQTSLNPSMRIENQLIETLLAHKRMNKRDAKQTALEMLEKVKINSPKDSFRQYPHELSGGMKQRVAIANALLCKPNLLIADEFTTNLDVTIQSEIITLVLQLQEEFNMEILFISHDLALIYESCDYMGVMYAGQIVESGKVSKVFKEPSHPYTKGLLEAIPTLSQKTTKKLQGISGFVPSLVNPPRGCRFHTRCKLKIKNVCDTEDCLETVLGEDHSVWCHLFN